MLGVASQHYLFLVMILCERVVCYEKLTNNFEKTLMASMIALIVISVVVMVMTTIGDKETSNPYEDTVGEPVLATTSATADVPDNSDKGLLLCRYARATAGTAREQIDIFIPTEVGYYSLNFVHGVYKTANYDIWRLNKMTAVDDTLKKRYDITNTGEFEAAIRLQGRSDFSGGSQHGDEMLTAVAFYFDGEITDITTVTDYRTFSEMKIVRDSLFYDPADHTTQLATHRVEYIINKDGVRTQQSVA